MASNSPDQLSSRGYFEFHCEDCGSDSGFRSRPRTFSERYLLPVFLLRPVRCAECFRRDYRLFFVPVRDRLVEAKGKPPVSSVGAGNTRNVA